MTTDKEIIRKVCSGKIDKKKLVRLGGTVAFVDILQDAITEARKDQEQKTYQELIREVNKWMLNRFMRKKLFVVAWEVLFFVTGVIVGWSLR